MSRTRIYPEPIHNEFCIATGIKYRYNDDGYITKLCIANDNNCNDITDDGFLCNYHKYIINVSETEMLQNLLDNFATQ